MPTTSIRTHGLALAVALTGLVTAAPIAARAADEPIAPLAPANDLEPRVLELEEMIRQLQEQLRELQSGAKPVEPAQVEKIVEERLKKEKPLAGWQDGFYLQSPDGNFRLRLRGYMQSDSRSFPSDGGDTGVSSFYLRRVRPIIEGTLNKNIDFRMMPDFGDGRTVLQDAYIDLKFWPQAQIRTGKFKEPFSLERLQSGAELLFIERSITNYLAPNRDVGLQVSGNLSIDTVGYAVGYFNGVTDGGSTDSDGGDDKDFVGRVFVQPFRNKAGSPLQGLGIGVAGTIGKRQDPLSGLAYRTGGRSAFFRYDPTAIAVGDQRRLSPQFYYYHGPFGLLGEHITSRQEVQEGTTRADLTNRGWFLQGSYVLTGEKASYRGVTPARPFDREKRQWGALELAARYGKVKVDSDAFRLGFAESAVSASEAKAFTLGLNWYLNRNVKAQFNYERTNFNRSIRFGNDRTDHEDTFLTRVQVTF